MTLGNWQPNDTEVVLVRVRSSGKIHRRVRLADRPGYLSFEACNLDDAAEIDVIPDLSDVADEHQFCVTCFGPLDEGHDDVSGVPI